MTLVSQWAAHGRKSCLARGVDAGTEETLKAVDRPSIISCNLSGVESAIACGSNTLLRCQRKTCFGVDCRPLFSDFWQRYIDSMKAKPLETLTSSAFLEPSRP